MKRRRSGGKPVLPQPLQHCLTCGQISRVRMSVVGWCTWKCYPCFSAWLNGEWS